MYEDENYYHASDGGEGDDDETDGSRALGPVENNGEDAASARSPSPGEYSEFDLESDDGGND
jgi:hypothetical protein